MNKNQNIGSFNASESSQSKLKFKNPIKVAGANPKSRLWAMRAKCWDCCGGQAIDTQLDSEVRHSIKQCELSDCPLYQFRQYQNKKALKVSTLASASNLSFQQSHKEKSL